MATQLATAQRRRRSGIILLVGVAIVAVAAVIAVIRVTGGGGGAESITIWGSGQGAVVAEEDQRSVTVGTRLRLAAPAQVTALRFYRAADDPNARPGFLWNTEGEQLARVEFDRSDVMGWTSASLEAPLPLPAGDYVVGYRAPFGRYAYLPEAFAVAPAPGEGLVTPLGGVYSYADEFPRQQFDEVGYLVDLVLVPNATPGRTKTEEPVPITELPRVPWEGGPGYYDRFPDATARGWGRDDFFPIAIWWATFSTDAHVQWDAEHGINTYVVTNPDADYRLMERNDMSWIGGPLPGMTRDSPAWVGDFLDDEVDGRFEPAAGHAHLSDIADKLPDHDKIRYANYTAGVVSTIPKPDAEAYVNNWTDVVSVDAYWYSTIPCEREYYDGGMYAVPIRRALCGTSAAYGRTTRSLSVRDSADGRLQPKWNFIENVYGGDNSMDAMTPEQVKGAAMSSIIAEARGLIWFNNSFAGPCGTGNAIRTAQTNPSWECAAHITAMGEVNRTIHHYAPVLNTQSYKWEFGPDLETILKVVDGYAYIFAMPDGSAGDRSFTLPGGISSRQVEVLDENRTLSVRSGRFVDTFAQESTYHIYKIKL